MLDLYPSDEPQPHHFDEQHSAFIVLMIGNTEVDVEITGSYVHADPGAGAPAGWRIETATVHSTDPSLHGQDVSALVDADAAALRRAEHALAYTRTEWLS